MPMLNYENVTNACTLAVDAGEHALIIGGPGRGKSLFAAQLFATLEGDKFFTQFSRWSDESVLFGVPDLRALRENGEITYKQRGILAAHWAFLDELSDASDVLLRTTLGILNERVFSRGSFSCQVPLQTAIATANFHRENEVTAAVWDRFTIRCEAPTLTREQRVQLWDGVDFESMPDGGQRSLASIAQLRELAKCVTIPKELVGGALEFAAKFEFSPRRERKAAWLVKVSAARRNEGEAGIADLLLVLPFLIPIQDGLAQAQFSAVEDLRNGLVKARDEMKQLRAIESVPSGDAKTLENLKLLTRNIKALRQLVPVSDNAKEARDAKVDRLASIHHAVQKDMGLVP